jgi:hypothetical protein
LEARKPGSVLWEGDALHHHWIILYDAERLHEELGDVPPAECELIKYRKDDSATVSLR